MAPAKRKPRKTATKPRKPPAPTLVEEMQAETGLQALAPLTQRDYRFCAAFVTTGKQVEAYREIDPDAKDPHRAAFRMMERPEIREHIRTIFRHISKERERAAMLSARSALLTLELADERVVEILQAPRRTKADMLSKDTKQLLVPGVVPGEFGGVASEAVIRELSNTPAPADDADLLKAAKLVYDRKQGIIKAEKPLRAPIAVKALYRPAWRSKPLELPPPAEGE